MARMRPSQPGRDPLLAAIYEVPLDDDAAHDGTQGVRQLSIVFGRFGYPLNISVSERQQLRRAVVRLRHELQGEFRSLLLQGRSESRVSDTRLITRMLRWMNNRTSPFGIVFRGISRGNRREVKLWFAAGRARTSPASVEDKVAMAVCADLAEWINHGQLRRLGMCVRCHRITSRRLGARGHCGEDGCESYERRTRS